MKTNENATNIVAMIQQGLISPTKAETLARRFENAATAKEKKLTDAVEKIKKYTEDRNGANERRKEIGVIWKKAKKSNDAAEMLKLERENNKEEKAAKNARNMIEIWRAKKANLSTEVKDAKADAKAVRRAANILIKADQQEEERRRKEQEAQAEELRTDITKAEKATAEAQAEENKKKEESRLAAAEAQAAAEERAKKRLLLAEARQAKGQATAEDLALLAVAATDKNAEAVLTLFESEFKAVRKLDTFKAFYKDMRETSLSRVLKDMKAASTWKMLAPLFDAAAVRIDRDNLTPVVFSSENVSPFLLVATANGLKVGLLARKHVNAVTSWTIEKAVMLLLMNATLKNICAKDKAAKAAAEAQKELLIKAAEALNAAAKIEKATAEAKATAEELKEARTADAAAVSDAELLTLQKKATEAAKNAHRERRRKKAAKEAATAAQVAAEAKAAEAQKEARTAV